MKQISLTQGKVAIVDDEDFERLNQYRWRYMSLGYAASGLESIFMHRLIMDAPKNLVVDHINGDRLDNRKENLRLIPIKFNVRNQRLSKNNTSGFLGVQKFKGKWIAQIMIDRKSKRLGVFNTPEEASAAYQARVKKLWEDAGYEYKPLAGGL